ncbi:hypothetical protein ACEPAF_1696 [Sanghuangporus sanghuang]
MDFTPGLEEVSVASPWFESAEIAASMLLHAVEEATLAQENFIVTLSRSAVNPLTERMDKKQIASRSRIEMLGSVLDFRGLVDSRVIYQRPFQLRNSDLQKSSPIPTLAALPMIAKHCPSRVLPETCNVDWSSNVLIPARLEEISRFPELERKGAASAMRLRGCQWHGEWWNIGELLWHIFDLLGKSSQFACALVCKSWCEVVLNRLWRVLESPKPLVALLIPMQKSSYSSLLMAKTPIRPLDWKTFNRYARRVRHLVIDFSKPEISPEVFYRILRVNPIFGLLPNLSTLKIVFDRNDDFNAFNQSALFMGPSVKEFYLSLPRGIASPICRHFVEYVARMPNLAALELDSVDRQSAAMIQGHLVTFLSALKSLERFVCAPYFATSDIVSALSNLPSLRSIEIGWPRFKGIGHPSDVFLFRPSLAIDAFPILRTLSFCATFKRAIALMEVIHAPQLAKIMISSPQLETAESLHHLLYVLARKRSRLENLSLDAVHAIDKSIGHLDDDLDIDRVTFEVLKPLLDFSELQTLNLSFHRPFHLNDTDLEKLLMSLPNLSDLGFCAEPLLQEPALLTTAVLPIIARRCPMINSLAMYIATRVGTPSLPTQAISFYVRFTHLKQIRFGTSPLAEEDVSGFAFYLSKFLPPTCKMDSLADVRWLNSNELRTAGHFVSDVATRRWAHVSSLLNVLVIAWEEENVHSRDLSLRTDTLEARVSILEAEKNRRVEFF